MAEEIGRQEFAEAAGAVRRMRQHFEGKAKELEAEAQAFRGAETLLITLAHADAVIGDLEARIEAAKTRLSEIEAETERAQEKKESVLATYRDETRGAAIETASVLAEEMRKRTAVETLIDGLDAEYRAAVAAHEERLIVLASEKDAAQAALDEIRAQIAKFKDLAG